MISSTTITGCLDFSSSTFIASAFFSSAASGVFFRHLSRSASFASASTGHLPSGAASSTTKAHSTADVVVTP